MSKIEVIAGRLRKATQSIAAIDLAIAESPLDFGLQMAAASMKHAEEELREDFKEFSELQGVPVCDYRLKSTGSSEPRLNAFTTTLAEFQKLFAMVYEAKTTQKKLTRAHVSAEFFVKTSFSLQYTYAGSIGVVLSLPRHETLYQGDDLDAAMLETFEMAKCNSSDQIKHYADLYGAPIIRSLYRWSDAHLRNDVVPVVGWRDRPEESLALDTDKLEDLNKAILETSDATQETYDVVGELQMASVRVYRFILEAEDGRVFRGVMDKSITDSQVLELPATYTATIQTESKVNYATEENIQKHTLKRLTLSQHS